MSIFSYVKEVNNYFLSHPNKRKLAREKFFLSLERATTLYVFLWMVFGMTFDFAGSSGFIDQLRWNLIVFMPLAHFYGIWREISLEYKTTPRYAAWRNMNKK